MLQTSHRVQKLDATAASLRAGELSPGKAHAIADAASVVPDEEANLLEGAATKSLSDVREECLKAKAKHKPDERHDQKADRVACRDAVDQRRQRPREEES